MNLNQTICALATPPLVSALALIRLSGHDAILICEKCFNKPLKDIKEKTIVYGDIVDERNTIDQVILLVYRAPKSFTGEDVVEIISHGSPLIVEEILAVLVKNGARLAEKGEFTMRGYLNNKFDLIQAEAINDMIHSTTKEAKNLSLLSLEGKTSSLILPYKDMIANLLASIEVNIDFPEYEDIEEMSHQRIDHDLKLILEDIRELIKKGREGNIIKNGINIAIVGKPNAGKSSLLNALINEDKAIVTDIEGTTRDIVEGEIVYKGIPIHFFDTAGIRESANTIEQIGIKKTKDIINKADYVIYVKDFDELEIDDHDIKQLDKEKLIVVTNKSDLIKSKNKNELYISALKKDYKMLLDTIYQKLQISHESFIRPSFNNERQLAKLRQIDTLLKDALTLNTNGLSLDLISVPLQSAYKEIIELLGGDYTQDLSEEIFSRFCVGK